MIHTQDNSFNELTSSDHQVHPPSLTVLTEIDLYTDFLGQIHLLTGIFKMKLLQAPLI